MALNQDPSSLLDPLRKSLRQCAHKEKALALQRYFKTGPGEYGEGDIFLGVKVPDIRKVARTYREITLRDIHLLIGSPIHEERLLALLILIMKYSPGDNMEKKKIFDLYMKQKKHINNWDLVDLSAGKIVGAYLMDKKKDILYDLAVSERLWDRRIAIMSTSHFIRHNRFADTLNIAEILLDDTEDLIQKAVGWMLREIGKRNMAVEESFLKKHCGKMPRTMLRYATESFPEKKRQHYLKSTI